MSKNARLIALISINIVLICVFVLLVFLHPTHSSNIPYLHSFNSDQLIIDPSKEEIPEEEILFNVYNPFHISKSILDSIIEPIKTSKLDGTNIFGFNEAEIPIAVMIENHPASRAQHSGLEEATIVYEALAEGGITRFMGIYRPEDIKKIGPVRSARPYFVDFAEEFKGVYVHAGGSDDALAQIALSNNIYAISENLEDFWRDTDYAKPHNLFTNTALLKESYKDEETLGEPSESYLHYKDENTREENPIRVITLDFSFKQYISSYQYNSNNNSFDRFHGGVKHNEISPKNVIILFMSYYPYDEEGRLKFSNIGEGEAWYFVDGQQIIGKWKKTNRNDKTHFLTESGEEMKFNRGQTWIEIIDSTDKVIVI